eukprot:RCo045788
MPAMILFRRRWQFASDDLVLPGLLGGSIHVTYLVLTALLFSFYVRSTYGWGPATLTSHSCAEHGITVAFFVFGLVLHCARVLVDFSIAAVSVRGTIMNSSSRRFMPKLLYTLSGLVVLEVGWNLWGIALMLNSELSCGGVKALLFDATLLANLCLVVVQLVLAYLMLDTVADAQRGLWEHKEQYAQLWETRCRRLFCCLRSRIADSSVFSDIARMLCWVWRGVDIVPSDVVAGMLLLYLSERPSPGAGHGSTSNGRDVPPVPPETLRTLDHYSRYFMGTYGWMVYAASRPRGCPRLLL